MDQYGIDKLALIPRVNPAFELPGHAKVLLPLYRKLIHSHSNCMAHDIGMKFYRGGVTEDGHFDILGKKYKVYMKPDNDELVTWLAYSPERFVGFLFLNPENGEDPREVIEKYRHIKGIIGIKLHPYWHRYPLSMAEDIAALCAERNWAILAHLGPGEYGEYRYLPKRFPSVPIIYCHGGIPYMNDVCAYAREQDNVFVDLSGTSMVDRKAASKALSLAGPRNCIFGSDGPLFNAKNDRYKFLTIQDNLYQNNLSKEAFEDVTYRNFSRIVEAAKG